MMNPATEVADRRTTPLVLNTQQRKLEQQFAAGQISKKDHERQLAVIAAARIGNRRLESYVAYGDLSEGEQSYLTQEDRDAMTGDFLRDQGVEVD